MYNTHFTPPPSELFIPKHIFEVGGFPPIFVSTVDCYCQTQFQTYLYPHRALSLGISYNSFFHVPPIF
jgi:hypothetical protein